MTLLYFSLQDSVIRILDAFYHDRHYARFFVLETIARVPYFGEFLRYLALYFTFMPSTLLGPSFQTELICYLKMSGGTFILFSLPEKSLI